MEENKKSRPQVSLTLYEDRSERTIGKGDIFYEGRLLGLIDDKGFNILAKQKDAAAKVFTGESLEVKEIPREQATFRGKRIVIVIKKKNSENIHRTLFITDPLESLSYVGGFKKSLGLVTKSGAYILIEDKKVEGATK